MGTNATATDEQDLDGLPSFKQTGKCLGACNAARDVEAGRGSQDEAVAWHRRCKGWVWSDRLVRDPKTGLVTHAGVLTVCDCSCHNHRRGSNGHNPRRCVQCGSTEGLDLDRGRCVDAHACAERLRDIIANDGLWQRLQVAKQRGAEARREANAARALARGDDVVQRKPRGPGRPTSGRCEHCGEPTKGGRFVAGHDAKLKGDLKRAAEAGDDDAIVELLCRSWPVHTLKVEPERLQAATLRADGVAGAEFIAARVAARLGEAQ